MTVFMEGSSFFYAETEGFIMREAIMKKNYAKAFMAAKA